MGKLTATIADGNNAAIGATFISDESKTNCGTMTINGGIIEAKSIHGAGIGGAYSGGDGGIITVNGGIVKAESSYETGIGGGQCGIGNDGGDGGIFTINGGAVYAKGDTGIGGGEGPVGGNGGIITINGGYVKAEGGTGAGIGGARGIGCGGNSGTITISGGIVEAKSEMGAGIGGGYTSTVVGTCEKITITGGIVKAESVYGAGIGSARCDTGMFGNAGDITISGGTVTAISEYSSAIGSGWSYVDLEYSGNIIIKGGHVIARSLCKLPPSDLTTSRPAVEAALTIAPNLMNYEHYYWRTDTESSFTDDSVGNPYSYSSDNSYVEFSYGYTYTVTLDPNYEGGTSGTLITSSDGKPDLPVITRELYELVGWFTDAQGGDEVTEDTVFSKNSTIFAHWTYASYDVILNTNGADSCDELTEYTYSVGATLPTPVKAGFTFGGWYEDSSFTGDPVTQISTTDSGEKTFYAKWIEKPDISFSTDAQSYTYNGTAQAFSITGTSFTDFDVSYIQDGQTVTAPTNAGSYDVNIKRAEDATYKALDVTLRGGLIINPKPVTATISAISDKNYTGSEIVPAVKAYDGETEIPADEYTVDYSDNTNAGTATVTLTDKTGGNYVVSGSTTFEIQPKSIEDATVTLNGELTYNGAEQTQEVSVSLPGFDDVTYDISGNKQTDVNTSGNYTLTVTANGNFTGSKDLEWNIEKADLTENTSKLTTARVRRNRTLAEALVTNGEMLGVGNAVIDGSFAWEDPSTVITENSTAKMKFTPADGNYNEKIVDVSVSMYSSGGGGGSSVARYTVKFDTNGGNTITSQTVTSNSKAAEPTKPTKDGYIFDGWYTDSEFTSEYDFDTKVTKNITLYAKWTEIEKEPDKPTQPVEPTAPEWKNPFTDVKENDWFFESVKYVNQNGLMSGTTNTTFAPNEPLTRGMLVTVLYRAEGEPTVDKSIPFSDVDANAYYANAVIWARQNGIVNGVTENEFAPDDNITREQIAAIMFRYAKYKGYDVSVGENTNILSYTDFDEISEYAISAMQYVVGSGLMKGKTETTINPKDNATRAEIAAILQRFIEANK